MEVKDLKQPTNLESGSKPGPKSSSTLIEVLFGGKVRPPTDAVKLRLTAIPTANKVEVSQVRNGSNQILSAVNTTSETTSDLDRLVKSLGGILKQASETELSNNRVQALQNEANQLVDKISEITSASSLSLPLSSPPGTDEVRKEVEKRIGRTLDAIFGDEAKKNLNIGHISLSKREQIIESVAKLEEAKRSVEKIKSEINDTRHAISNILNNFEVAHENSEAAGATVRDLDRAVDLASQAKLNIAKNPEEALGSASKLDSSSLGLLE